MLSALAHKARAEARAAAISVLAGMLLAVGLAFFTVAAWVALSAAYPVSTVATILGGAYVGVGLILMAINAMGRRHDRPQPTPTQRADPMPAMMQAFATGVAAGQGAASHRR